MPPKLVIAMPTKPRLRVILIAAALFYASFSAFLWRFYVFHDPSQPQRHMPAPGRMHTSNNHGTFSYLTDEEATGQALLDLSSLFGFALIFAVVPKRRRTPLEPDPALASPTRHQLYIFGISIAVFLAIINYAGPKIVHFAVSHGIVLDFS